MVFTVFTIRSSMFLLVPLPSLSFSSLTLLVLCLPLLSRYSPIIYISYPCLSPVCCPSQLSAAAADYLVREPPWSEAAVHRSEVLDSAGGHRRSALSGYRLLDNAM